VKAVRALLRCLLPAMLAAAGLAAHARAVLELDTANQPVLLKDWGDMWLDTTGALDPASVESLLPLQWRPSHEEQAPRIPEGAALWIRFTVPATPEMDRWYVNIPSTSVGRATLYARDATGRWSPASAGTLVPVEAWPVPGRQPLLPVPVSAEEPRRILLRIESPGFFPDPIQFVSEGYVSRTEQRTSLLLGAFVGLQLLIAALMAAKAAALRDRAYASGAAAVFLLACAQACSTGLAGLHLWSRNPWLATHATSAFALASVVAIAFCTLGVLSVAERWPRLNACFLAGFCALAVLAAGLLAALPALHQTILPALFVAGAGPILLLQAWAIPRSTRYAQSLLAGSLALALSAVPAALHVAGLLGSGFWSLHALQFGTIAFSLLLLGTLAMRIAYRRENMRRILGLDRMDPATGLINRFEFTERFLRLAARSQRLRYTSAVFVVEITNMAALAREYGRAAVDEIPLRVSRRLLSTVRDIDTVGRIGECRFGILVEGPLSAADAASIGPRLVGRCLMPFRNKPQGWLPRVRVAQALVPFAEEPANVVLEQLEDLLGQVPADSRKAVFTVAPNRPAVDLAAYRV